MSNYVITHLHSDFSNGTTNIDSITKYKKYIEKAKQNSMKAIAFTEHGNIFSWYNKYKACKENDIKFIFGVEMYITKTLDKKIRDNYHCCLYARNNEGIKELKKAISKANNRKDNHFYYVPRISIDEFLQLSENIIISTACLGGILASEDEELKQIYLQYLIQHKDRCFLEIQHHSDKSQFKHNQNLYKLHKQYNIPLITGTDTHILDKKHVKAREILQKAKGIHFDNEDGWDLVFKSYDELIESYKKQNSLSMDVIYEAINNTNKLADMVEEYEFSTKSKYPKLYNNSKEVFEEKLQKGIKWRGIDKYDNFDDYKKRIDYETETYEHNDAIDFMLLEEDYKSEMRNRGIEFGYSRGSCSGSEICYILGITEIDSIKHKLNFERFMNKERVSLADIDTDWYSPDRQIVKDYLYNKKGLYCCDIVTFNTIALKGAIRDVGRAMYGDYKIPADLQKRFDDECEHYGKPFDDTSKEIASYTKKYLEITNYICENVENNEKQMRNEYPELFEYVDLLQGVIVSVGSHPSATIVSPVPVDEYLGTFTASTNEYPISQINMKEVDSLNFVKLDILGLDNIGIINQTCKLVGIERLTPNNTPPDDINVWNSIKEDTLGIFQWESDFATSYLKQILDDNTVSKIKEFSPNITYMDLLSMGNGAIRPAGESYRDELAKGIFRDNGHPALNEFLAPTLGYLCFQEQIIEFLHSFCGYTMGEADIVRRGFAKKTGTEQFIPKIKSGFIQTMKEKYDVSEEESENLIVNFIQVIEDASSYLFSLNHADPYTWIGYICGYLRYYYPLEFLTTMFNINSDDEDKTNKITQYAFSQNIKIKSPLFRYSKGNYFMDKKSNTIYKGIGSIKYLNSQVGDELFDLKSNVYSTFLDLLIDIKERVNCNNKQLERLIKIDFFKEFGSVKKLLHITDLYNKLYGKKSLSKDKLKDLGLSLEQVLPYGNETEKQINKLDSLSLLNDLIKTIPDDEFSTIELVQMQKEVLGYVDYVNPKLDKKLCLVNTFDGKYNTKKLSLYCLNNGKSVDFKLYNRTYKTKPIEEGDIIYTTSMKREPKPILLGTDENGKKQWGKDMSSFEWILNDYNIIKEL